MIHVDENVKLKSSCVVRVIWNLIKIGRGIVK